MKTPYERGLDLTVRMYKDEFEIFVHEPESGEVDQKRFPYSFDEHPEFDKAIGNEIYSWLSLWADYLEEEDDD